jgi:hypothetical protein
MTAGLRPPSWIFEHSKIAAYSPCGSEVKILKLQVALVGLKWSTKFQKDWSDGLKDIAFTKIQDGGKPPSCFLVVELVFIVFLDPENPSVESNIVSLSCIQAEI